jgi:hypothetical protein
VAVQHHGEETDFTDGTGVSEGPTLSILIKKTSAKDRHYRHDRHAGEEAPYPSRFFGDNHRDDRVTVTMVTINDRYQKPIGTGSVTTVTVMTVDRIGFLSGGRAA